MQYRYKPRKVEAAQWSPDRPGDVIGLLANHGLTWDHVDDSLYIPVDNRELVMIPASWLVIDGGVAEVYTDAEFRHRFDALITRARSVTNTISGPVSGFTIQTGGDVHGNLHL